jgi:hypothetical protein
MSVPTGGGQFHEQRRRKDEETKSAEPQKPAGKSAKGLVEASKEDRGPWLGLAQLARN